MAATSCLFLITGECLTDDDIGPLSELIILGVHAWDTSSLGLDINEELKTFVSSNPSPQSYNQNEKGESVIRVFSDKLCVAALINPGLFTLASQLEWLLQTPFINRHLVFAGRQSDELGDWLLKDASVSPARLGQMLRSAPDASLPPDHRFSISCALNAAGSSWKSAKPPLTEFRAHAQQSELDPSAVPGAVQLAGFLAGKQCGLANVEQRLRPAGTVGNIRIAKPTLYVFPAGLGDSCYLGVDGFGLLVNTGAGRTPAFWPFLAHLDRVDGLLLSHWDHDNLPGLLALLERLSVKEAGGGAPVLGCALLPCRPRLADEAASDAAAANGGQHRLEASIRRDAVSAMRLFRSLGVHLEEVRRLGTGQPQPMTLYSKLGNGSLDLYPLQPVADAKEFKDFFNQLLHSQASSAGGKPWPLAKVGNCQASPAHANSLCCLLVWRPSDPKAAWTRLLLPGCCPQLRVIEGLEKVRGLDCLKTAEYSPAAAAAAAHKPASAAAKKTAAASGDHAGPTAAAAKPRPKPSSATAAAPAAKKAAAAAPIVKKPVASAADPGKTAAPAASGKSTNAASKSSMSASASARPTAAAPKKEPAKAGAGVKTAGAAASKPTSAAGRKAAAAPASSKSSATPAAPAATPVADAAAASPPAAAEESLVTEQHQPDSAAAVEEIPLASGDGGSGNAAQEVASEVKEVTEQLGAQQQEQQEAWALNANNTNSAEADSAELISADQPLGLPAPAPIRSSKPSGGASAAAVNYGPVHPLHFDLAYVPGHGERQFADSEYFKRVRARYYVLSSCDPQPAVLDSLLEGKSAWPELEVTLIPTHSNQLLSTWLSQNAVRMQQLHVTVAPSASDCRIRLQQQGDEADEQACTAYRVEF
ncbi:hypothetical protein BOX15_Mlig006229g1 [Macrostomum lignano]|uniref:Uncharacterized protein n=1 Tax=Macrostomum lignano TaxID=282301 RepID=A0A267GS83_9PLAT|nr:hypothetical protein BOX15_Mlig006229g1 [Macrostomum lignano]